MTVDDSAATATACSSPARRSRFTQRLRNGGTAAATGVSATLGEALPELTLSQTASAYPDLGVGATQPNATPYAGTLAASAACGEPLAMSMQVDTAQGTFAVPVSVPTGAQGAGAGSSPRRPARRSRTTTRRASSSNLAVGGVAGPARRTSTCA